MSDSHELPENAEYRYGINRAGGYAVTESPVSGFSSLPDEDRRDLLDRLSKGIYPSELISEGRAVIPLSSGSCVLMHTRWCRTEGQTFAVQQMKPRRPEEKWRNISWQI